MYTMKVGKWFSAPGAATRNQHGGSQVPGEEEEEEEGGSSVGKYLAKALAGPSRSVQYLRFLVCVHVFMSVCATRSCVMRCVAFYVANL